MRGTRRGGAGAATFISVRRFRPQLPFCSRMRRQPGRSSSAGAPALARMIQKTKSGFRSYVSFRTRACIINACKIAPGDTVTLAAGLRGPVLMCTKSMTMEPANSRNLEMFLAGYRRCGMYHLIPAVIGASEPNFLFELLIRKRRLSVKAAAQVTGNDIKSLALRLRGMKFDQ